MISGSWRKRRGALSLLAAAALAATGLSSCSSPTLKVLYGNFRFGQGDYSQATISYIKVLGSGDETGVVRYDLANVYYALGETEPAIDAMRDAASPAGWAERRFRAYYNLGNFYFDMGDFDRAVSSYIEALKQNPEDRDAKINLELALKRVASGAATKQAGAADGEGGDSGPLEERYRSLLRTAQDREENVWQSNEEREPEQPSGW